MRIALFGGSFDPPHVGHVKIVKEALKSLDIDKFFIVPTFLNPFKDTYCAPPYLRKKWLEKLFSSDLKVKILSYECDQKRPVTTIETVRYIQKTYNPSKIYLIVGSDSFWQLPKWSEYEKLKEYTEFIIALRENAKPIEGLKNLDINVNISSTYFRLQMDEKYIPPEIATEVKEFYIRKSMDNRNERIVRLLDEKKAENIHVFDMRNKDYFVDSVIIATTMGERHGLSLLDFLKKELKDCGESFLNIDADDNWTVIDMGDILIHLMTEQYREKYNLELFLKEREDEMRRLRGVD
ncbi:MAG: nicotinate (nicotinamide) nucleotide adenylyltransferase [Sulfurospirillaceae bacterium]|nr:nicotinate (nicotinamide) nucleotide adenylyltransferase [Sulfurospirillaceae bacterium]